MSKLLETLVNGSQRIAVTIDGEDLMEFVQAVYEDAHHKAEIAVEKQNSVSSNFASADFRKIKTYNFRKSESY